MARPQLSISRLCAFPGSQQGRTQKQVYYLKAGMISLFNNHRIPSSLESPLYLSIWVPPDDPTGRRRNGSWACRLLRAQRRREALQQRNGTDGRKQVEEAIAEFDLALSRDGSMAAAFRNRALAEQRTGSLSSAIKDYTRLIELNPE